MISNLFGNSQYGNGHVFGNLLGSNYEQHLLLEQLRCGIHLPEYRPSTSEISGDVSINNEKKEDSNEKLLLLIEE